MTSEIKNSSAQQVAEDTGDRGVDSPETTADEIETGNLTVTIYSSRSEIRNPVRLIVSIFYGFVEGRGLAWRLFVRDIRGMYRQTLLGLFWAFLPPIANTAIWLFLKSQNVFQMGDTVVDSTLFILTGMILWQAFIDAFQSPMQLLNSNRNMLSKLKFPRESLLMVGFGEVVFNLLIRLVLLIPAFWWFGATIHATAVAAIPGIIGLILLGMALGLLIMPIGSLYQDVGRFIALFVPFWMIITPIIYVPPTSYPGSLLNWVNPASPLLIASRDLLLTGQSAHLGLGLIFGVIAVPLILLGLIVYRISIPLLIERMPA